MYSINSLNSYHIYLKTRLLELREKTQNLISKILEISKLNICVYGNPHDEPRLRKPLKFKELSIIECNKLIKTVEIWCSIANSKKSQSALLLPNFLRNNLPHPFYRQRSDIFMKSSSICDGILQSLSNNDPLKNNHTNQVKRVFTENVDQSNEPDEVQAIAITTEVKKLDSTPYLFIAYLAAHPQNLVSPLNNSQPNRVARAATRLIEHLVTEVCPKSNLERIELVSGGNIDFYKDLGFIEIDFRLVLYLNQIQLIRK